MSTRKVLRLAHQYGVTKRTMYRWLKNPAIMLAEGFDRNDFWRAKEVADQLGVHRSFVYRHYHEGVFRGLKLSAKILLIDKESVRRWLERSQADLG